MSHAASDPRRSWIRFLRQALGGADLGADEAGRALDLATSFCRWRAAALFEPSEDGGMRLASCSAVLRAEEAALEGFAPRRRDIATESAGSAGRPGDPLPGAGAERDGEAGGVADALVALAGSAPSSAWPIAEILDEPRLAPLRGAALRLECLSLSVHAGDSGRPAEGFLLALWEEEDPAAGHLDRAHLTALALARPLARGRPAAGADAARAAQRAAGAGDAGSGAEAEAAPREAERARAEARRAQRSVLRELEALSAEGRALQALQPHSRLLGDLDAAVAEAQRRRQPLALVLIDADDLAEVNDEHGPRAGDRLLQEIAAILLEEAEQGELVVRYGMEEFAVLARGTPKEIRARARQIQMRVRQRALPGPSAAGRGSVSVGAACLPDPLAADAASLRLKAEQALELARRERPGGLIIL